MSNKLLQQLKEKREKLNAEMKTLWDVKSERDWTPEESKKYEDLRESKKKAERDIDLRTEFLNDVKSSLDKEDKKYLHAKGDASIGNIIRRMYYLEKPQERGHFKDDQTHGKVADVLKEHELQTKNNGNTHCKDGFLPIPDSAFAPTPKKRASVTDTVAADLIETELLDSMYAFGLYAKTWVKEIGVPMVSGLTADQVVPSLTKKPAFGWIPDDGQNVVSSMNFGNIPLKPKYASSSQVLSLGAQLRTARMSAMRFVQMELLNSFRSGLDKSFLNDQGNNNTPKGVRKIIADYNGGSNSIEPAAGGNTKTLIANWNDLLIAEGLIEDTDDAMPISWLISTKLKRAAQRILKFAVSGSMPLFYKNMLGDTPVRITNAVPTDLEIAAQAGYAAAIKPSSNASPTQLMLALCIQPKSLLVGRWNGGLGIKIDTSGKFAQNNQVYVSIVDACNIISRRPSSLSELKNIVSFAGLGAA